MHVVCVYVVCCVLCMRVMYDVYIAYAYLLYAVYTVYAYVLYDVCIVYVCVLYVVRMSFVCVCCMMCTPCMYVWHVVLYMHGV